MVVVRGAVIPAVVVEAVVVTARRGVHNGNSKGSLICQRNPVHTQWRATKRGGAIVGTRQPHQVLNGEYGQLQYKKVLLHSTFSGAYSGNGTGALRPMNPSWATLLMAMRRCVDSALAVVPSLKEKMLQLTAGDTGVSLSPREAAQVVVAQKQLRYELHQYLLRLEEEVAGAGEQELLDWLRVFRIAGVRLPPLGATAAQDPDTMPQRLDGAAAGRLSSTCGAVVAASHSAVDPTPPLWSDAGHLVPYDFYRMAAPVQSDALCGTVASTTGSEAGKPWAPSVVAHSEDPLQVFDLRTRVAALTREVLVGLEDIYTARKDPENAPEGEGGSRTSSTSVTRPSRRQLFYREQRRQQLLDDLAWHRLAHVAV